MADDRSESKALAQRREAECRLGPSRWLRDLDEAESFLEDRQLLTLTPDCSLPSLFGACEPAADPNAKGFAKWPDDKWWWDSALAERDVCLKTKLHRGKVLFLAGHAIKVADALCRAELVATRNGKRGAASKELIEFLDAVGPALLDDVKDQTPFDTSELRRIRNDLEPRGVLLARDVELPARSGGHRHTTELALWSQRQPIESQVLDPLSELVALGVRASVTATRREVRRWFTWDVTDNVIDTLLHDGRLAEPESGWLSAGPR